MNTHTNITSEVKFGRVWKIFKKNPKIQKTLSSTFILLVYIINIFQLPPLLGFICFIYNVFVLTQYFAITYICVNLFLSGFRVVGLCEILSVFGLNIQLVKEFFVHRRSAVAAFSGEKKPFVYRTKLCFKMLTISLHWLTWVSIK